MNEDDATLPAYQRRFLAWWELSSFLDQHIAHAELLSLLARLHNPLDRWLWDKPPPSQRMAFDQKPKPRAIEMATAFVAAFARGQYDRQTNNEIEKFLVKILAIEKGDVGSAPVLMMQATYEILLREGAITSGMTIAEKHRAVLARLGKREDQRGFGYEWFRTQVLGP